VLQPDALVAQNSQAESGERASDGFAFARPRAQDRSVDRADHPVQEPFAARPATWHAAGVLMVAENDEGSKSWVHGVKEFRDERRIVDLLA
jgi:hypothetical protein